MPFASTPVSFLKTHSSSRVLPRNLYHRNLFQLIPSHIFARFLSPSPPLGVTQTRGPQAGSPLPTTVHTRLRLDRENNAARSFSSTHVETMLTRAIRALGIIISSSSSSSSWCL